FHSPLRLLSSLFPYTTLFRSFHPQAHLTEEDAQRVPDAGERLWRSWSPYWDLDRTVLVEKSPPNLMKMRYFQEIFPRSRFVVVTDRKSTRLNSSHVKISYAVF